MSGFSGVLLGPEEVALLAPSLLSIRLLRFFFSYTTVERIEPYCTLGR